VISKSLRRMPPNRAGEGGRKARSSAAIAMEGSV
jgi:hypothetical protein